MAPSRKYGNVAAIFGVLTREILHAQLQMVFGVFGIHGSKKSRYKRAGREIGNAHHNPVIRILEDSLAYFFSAPGVLKFLCLSGTAFGAPNIPLEIRPLSPKFVGSDKTCVCVGFMELP